MKHYLQTADEVLAEVGSSHSGLTSEESAKRLSENGPNKLAEGKKTSLFVKFLQQLADPMIIVLLAAAVVSLVTTIISNANNPGEKESFADTIIIAVVVLLNAILGVVQESKAEQAIKALQTMTEATCKVLRNGVVTIVKSQEIVVGDVVLLEAGDNVPADCRILESASLKVEESALTGESVPSDKFAETLTKDVSLGDRKNMLYLGSTVVYGRAKAVVVATAMATEMGKIANVLNTAKEEKTPLQIKMASLSKILTFIVIGICVIIFIAKFIGAGGQFTLDVVLDSFMVAIGLAVAAIPEGLATVVTIVLSIGVTNMSKKNAIIRKMTAVETLGCAEIICSDKTGTLTQNKMTVVEDYTFDKPLLATAMALCSDATLVEGKAVGEPTECALVNYANENELPKDTLEEAQPRIAEAPFDSMRKMMSTLHKTDTGVIQYTKGAPDEIVARCDRIWKEGKILPMSDKDRKEILAHNAEMANNALRVLAAAFTEYQALPDDVSPEKIERNLVFVGLCGMIDPVRPEVIDAIAQCRTAGIRPIMITGDHIDTAVAIAKQLGIITDASQALLGAKLDEMSDEEFEKTIANYSVYARVQPEHKVRIVTTWKKLGKVCAMTGDGVNDAPSIKSADIGVGMGITGTDVTKNTADMVLADDNFATIVAAVGEGRRIYDNIRKCIQFLLSSNLAEVIAIFVATMCGFTLLKPAHLLWINLVTDTIPAIALGAERAEKDIMSRAPRSKNEGIFAHGLGLNVALHGVFVALITLAAYFVGVYMENGFIEFVDGHNAQGITMAFLTMSMTEIFHAYNNRSSEHSIFTLHSHNKILWFAMIGSLALTTAVIYVPGVNDAFGFVDANGQGVISFAEYVIALALAFAIIPIVELQKLVVRAVKRGKAKKIKA